MDSSRASIGIYGSCVSRDAVATMRPESVDLQFYVARQSMARLGTRDGGSIEGLDSSALESAFQRRMVDGDAAESVLPLIGEKADALDLLLIDLVDERLGLVGVDGHWLTDSAELRAADQGHVLQGAEMLDFGTDRHFDLFRRGVVRLGRVLRAQNLLTRTLVIEAPFAADIDDPHRATEAQVSHLQQLARVMNQKYERYYEYMRASGFPVLKVPESVTAASTTHRWGLAAFHYTPVFYDVVCAGIDLLARHQVRVMDVGTSAPPDELWSLYGRMAWSAVPQALRKGLTMRLRGQNGSGHPVRFIVVADCSGSDLLADRDVAPFSIGDSTHLGPYRYVTLPVGEIEVDVPITLSRGTINLVAVGPWTEGDAEDVELTWELGS